MTKKAPGIWSWEIAMFTKTGLKTCDFSDRHCREILETALKSEYLYVGYDDVFGAGSSGWLGYGREIPGEI